jgi:hypothetical protein
MRRFPVLIVQLEASQIDGWLHAVNLEIPKK